MAAICISLLFFQLVVIVQGGKLEQGAAALATPFLEPTKNVTVEVGKDATLTCVVSQLQGYRIAWVKENTKTVLTIGSRVISRDRRISVSHDESEQNWMIHIANAQLGDTGAYLCQINTDPSQTESAFIEVVLPPDMGVPIVEVQLHTSSGTDSKDCDCIYEGLDVYFHCQVKSNHPQGKIVWFLNDRIISSNDSSAVMMSEELPNGHLVLQNIERGRSGEYACEAQNKVGKARSLPISLDVQYPPEMDVLEANITVNATNDITIPCTYKANPTQLTKLQWYHNGEYLDVSDKSRFDGATLDQPSLVIKSVSEADLGVYTCVAGNQRGIGESTVFLDVYSKPKVIVRIKPESPVREEDHLNVTLFCDVLSGNPTSLIKVWWYMDDDFLWEGVILQCDTSVEEDDCTSMDEDGVSYRVDPERVSLVEVDRLFRGNFSCVGFNEAGMSEMSPKNQLEVLYPPGQATIFTDNIQVVKGESLTLTCHVADLGQPPVHRFIWTRGGDVVSHVTSSTWVISPVTREVETNISCKAVNAVGRGTVGWISIEVLDTPECGIRQSKRNGEIELTCSATANPNEVSFSWKKEDVNFSILDLPEAPVNYEDLADFSGLVNHEDLRSVAHLGVFSEDTMGTYYCFVTNVIGRGDPCKSEILEQSFYSVLKRLDEVSSQLDSMETEIENLGDEEAEVLVKLTNQDEKINKILEILTKQEE